MPRDVVLKDFADRRAREHAKAVKKYGVDAADAPTGDPKRDAFDYAINECVGLLRYAEILEARLRALPLSEGFREEAISVCRQVAASGSRHALDLIDIRQRLQRHGFALGKAEAA